MRIAIDARLVLGSSTGDSAYWTGLLEGFAKLAPDANFLFISNAAEPLGIPSHLKFEWITVRSKSSRYWSMVSLPLAARRARADLLHVQYNLSPLVGRRGVTTIHDVSFFVGPEWFKPSDLQVLRRFVPASARRAAAVLTVSDTSKSEIIRYIPAADGKTFATPLATPVHIERCSPPEAAALLQPFDIGEPFLLTVGTRWPRKNVRLAIDAANLAGRRLLVTGKAGWGKETLGEHAKTTGYLDSRTLSALYSSAALYLAPSFHEGFGLPVLEAFKCGCPVMCSEGGALPEVAGDAAQVVKSWDAEVWADQIKRLLAASSNLESLRNKGFERERKFSWERTAALTMDAYRWALGKAN